MATPTRLANKTIDSLELAADVLTGIVTDFGSVSDFFAQDLAEAKFNMNKKRQGRIAEASTAATRIALGLLILERIVTDARQGRFEENRYPKYR
jgi:hypothetical protein